MMRMSQAESVEAEMFIDFQTMKFLVSSSQAWREIDLPPCA